MSRRDFVTGGVIPGALGGVVGGLVFGGAMAELGTPTSVASLVRLDSVVIGYIVHMAIAVTVGVGLGILVWHQRPGLGETLFWGLVYGTLWWFVGPLTLAPLILGEGVAWSSASAQAAFAPLIGHILYGASAALAIVLLRLRHEASISVSLGALLRGGLAGLLAAWMLGGILAAQGQLPTFVSGMPSDSRLALWLVALLVGLLAGVGFAFLYPQPIDSLGAGLIRGAMYGFLWWVAVPLSVLPLLNGGSLPWGLLDVRAVFPSFLGYVLFGAALAVFYQWLCGAGRLLMSDMIARGDHEGVATQGLRVLARGAVSGLLGGVVFTGVMVQIGALGTVASLIGASSPVTGFFVHLAIANIVGASYGVFFQRQSYDMGSALGWGASYGFIWWIIGPLTLMPVFLGSTPQWTADVAASTFPNLVGHLAYGAALGVTFQLLEARHKPWWVPQREAQAERVARRREQVLTSGPALWTLVVVIALTLPVLLGGGDLTALPEPVY